VPRIRPFRGTHYDLRRVGGLREVIGPPEDVPTLEQVVELTAGRPYHCLLLERGNPAEPTDYSLPAQRFENWLAEGILREPARPAFYVYEHIFQMEGRSHRRLGFFAVVDLRDRGPTGVLPHERILNENLQIRLALLRQVRANTSAVFTLMRDQGQLGPLLDGAIESLAQKIEGQDDEGGRHRVWAVDDREIGQALIDLTHRRALYIADGHHRYAAADAYRGGLVASGTEPGPANYVMSFVTSADDPSVAVLSIHRELCQLSLDGGDWADRLEPYFELDSLDDDPEPTPESVHRHVADLAADGNELPCFILLEGRMRSLQRLRLRSWEAVRALLPGRPDSVLRTLDITVLHRVVLERALGIEPAESEAVINFTPDTLASARRVLAGESAATLFVRPTGIGQILAAADAGERMPQKSTYFYPKVPAGIVLYSLRS
jgi:uncharacterized protein (DUF1015 family)